MHKLFYIKPKLYFAKHLILNSYSYSVSIALGFPIMLLFLWRGGVFYMLLPW
jgi:hypothetical protein